MPGIVGIITRMPPQRAAAELRAMVESMRHEDFYTTGTWCDEELGLYAGWVERDAAAASALPMRSEDGGKTLVFSGEDFPHAGLRAELRSRGHDVGMGPGDHLIHMAEEDQDFPLGLNGQFHGVLADRASGTITLFNDRHGLRRLYYHQAAEAFYFAAEAKAILALRPELRSIDPRSLGEVVSCGCVLEDRSLFKEIFVLPCASSWKFVNARLHSKGAYFNRGGWEQQTPLDAETYYSEVRAAFSANLPRYFASTQQIGVSLTGGLDTRTLMAWHKPQPGSLPCYTFGGVYRECRDVRIARRIARICGQSHQVIPVDGGFLCNFLRYAERTVYLTDGCAGVQQSPDLYVNERARAIAPIRMTGNYGDQVLRHITTFRPGVPTAGLYSADFQAHIAAASLTYACVAAAHPLTLATQQQTSWHYYGLLALESTQVAMRTPFLDNDLIRLLYRSPASALASNDLRVRLLGDGDRNLRNIRSDLGFAGRGGPLASRLSSRFHHLTMRLEYACEHGDPRWLAQIDRIALASRLEKMFVGRHKFTHFSLWYRNGLREDVRAMLLDDRTRKRPYFQLGAVEQILASHLSGQANHTPAIHKILTLEYIHRLFIDAP